MGSPEPGEGIAGRSGAYDDSSMTALYSSPPFCQYDAPPSCPFCPYTAASNGERDLYLLLQHTELEHPEDGSSPFIVQPPSRGRSVSRGRSPSGMASTAYERSPSAHSDDDVYVECPAYCGEVLHLRELSDHMELHELERMESAARSRSASREPPIRPPHNRASSIGAPVSHNLLAPPPMDDAIAASYGSAPAAPRRHSDYQRREWRDSHGFMAVKDLMRGPASVRPRKAQKIPSAPADSRVRRLGKAELGPFAFEKHMPSWLWQQLKNGPQFTETIQITQMGQLIRVQHVENETPCLIPLIAQLIERDPGVSRAFLCSPSTKHIFKTSREGGFCGYRNIQMLVSFIQASRLPGCQFFPTGTPTIPQLQDMIEAAWDHGINPTGRIETGGIKGTRKYIGTPEAQALFLNLNIGIEATAFNKVVGGQKSVHDGVLENVMEYFRFGVNGPQRKVYQTANAPIYFQHPGHSLTIIGLEIRKDGTKNLLVFDPMFKTSTAMLRLINLPDVGNASSEKLLRAYRRGDDYLRKHKNFECLKLTKPIVPLVAGLAPPPIRRRSSSPDFGSPY